MKGLLFKTAFVLIICAFFLTACKSDPQNVNNQPSDSLVGQNENVTSDSETETYSKGSVKLYPPDSPSSKADSQTSSKDDSALNGSKDSSASIYLPEVPNSSKESGVADNSASSSASKAANDSVPAEPSTSSKETNVSEKSTSSNKAASSVAQGSSGTDSATSSQSEGSNSSNVSGSQSIALDETLNGDWI